MLGSVPAIPRPRNLLLASLPAAELDLLTPHLRRISLRRGASIAASTSAMVRICFPETIVASFGETRRDGTRFDIGMIGREGLIGWPVLLGLHHSSHSGRVLLAAGDALVMPADILTELIDRHRQLHAWLLRFVQAFTIQMGQTIVANLRDDLAARLARWLLMLHDRVVGDILPVTHGELAAALHVRRSSVTDTLHIMEGERILRCTRGVVMVRDRAALTALAGESYGAAERSYRALVAPFGKTGAVAPATTDCRMTAASLLGCS